MSERARKSPQDLNKRAITGITVDFSGIADDVRLEFLCIDHLTVLVDRNPETPSTPRRKYGITRYS